jgi:hypothetical protein
VGGGAGRIWRADINGAAPEWSGTSQYFTAGQVANNPSGVYVFDDPGARKLAPLWLTGNLYLARRHQLSGAGDTNSCFIVYDDGAQTLTALRGAAGNSILNAEASAFRFIVPCPDRENNRIIWIVPDGDATAPRTLTLYSSSLTDPAANWKKLYVANPDLATMHGSSSYDEAGVVGIFPAFAGGGYLYFTRRTGAPAWASGSSTGMAVYRLPIY